MKPIYSQTHLDFLRENYLHMMVPDLTVAFNTEFGLSKTPGQIKSTLSNHRILSGRPVGVIPGTRRMLTKTQEDYIREEYKRLGIRELAADFNTKFGTCLSVGQFRYYVKNHKINCGRSGCFEKGSAPANKGIKGWDAGGRSHETRFNAGHKPQTWLPVGSEVTDSDGYRKVKVSDDPVPSRFNWRFVHRLEWEKANGPIPKGTAIIFVDGDRSNCDTDNLVLLSRAELCYLNKNGYNELTDELKPSFRALAKLISTSHAAGNMEARE